MRPRAPGAGGAIRQTRWAQGWLGINIPEEYGGAGGGAIEVAILLEELGEAFLDLAFWVFRTVTWGGLAISRDGTDEQRNDLLPTIASGELKVCFSLTEPDAGSDAAAIALAAIEDGDDFVLNGQKVFTSGFKVSDLDVVATRTAVRRSKHHGITNFIVDTKSPGLEWSPIETLGHWPLGTAMLYFHDVRVPKTRMFGTVHDGWADLGVYLRYERLCLSAARTGAAGGGPRRFGVLRQGAPTVRSADLGLPGGVTSSGRHADHGRDLGDAGPPIRGSSSTVASPTRGTPRSSSSTPVRRTKRSPTSVCRCSVATATRWSTTCNGTSGSHVSG